MLAGLTIGLALLWSHSPETGAPSVEPASTPAPALAEPGGKPGKAVPVVSVAADVSSATDRRANAYRLVLDGGRVSLEAVESIHGRFRQRRSQTALPGMIRCRLLDADGAVLAEELLPAPDFACLVLDPMVPDSAGAPKPAAMTATGPVVFQTRLPEVAGATVLEIVRIESVSTNSAESATGRLLAQIALPAR